MHIIRNIKDLRQQIATWRTEGSRISFVPTMGALHEGHLSLVNLARNHSDKIVVSIFVNPTQFGPNEDFSHYPRTEAQDLYRLNTVKTDMVFLPTVEEMYPAGFTTAVTVKGVSEGLCGAFRPGHFDGVATVVTKLFNMVTPDVVIFGEKDYQQLMVVRQLVRDLNMPVQVIGAPVLRETDGLAMSSRNRYLNSIERKTAAQLYTILSKVAEDIRSQKPVMAALLEGIKQLRGAGFSKVDYMELHNADNLQPMPEYKKPARLLVAAYMGNTRLIDNIEV